MPAHSHFPQPAEVGSPEDRHYAVTAGMASLDDAHRDVLQLCALIWVPASRSQLLECLELAGCHAPDGLPWLADTLGTAVELLLAAGLLSVSGARISCPMGVAEPAARLCMRGGRSPRMIDAVRKVFRVADHRYGHAVRSFNEGIRDLRLCLHAGQYADFQRQIQALQGYFSAEWKVRHPYLTLFDTPFDAAWHSLLPPDLAAQAAATVLAVRANRLEPATDALAWLIERGRSVAEEQVNWYATVIAEHLVLLGRMDEAEAWALRQRGHGLRGLISLLRGDYAASLASFELFLQDARKLPQARRTQTGGLVGVASVVALIGSGDPVRLEVAAQQIAQVMRLGSGWVPVYAALGYAARAALAVTETPEAPSAEGDSTERDPLASLFLALCAWWLDPDRLEQHTERLQRLLERAERGGYRWIAAECTDLLRRLAVAAQVEQAELRHQTIGTRPLAEAIRRQSSWERGLGALAKLAAEMIVPAAKPQLARLVWMLTFDAATRNCTLEPREQKRDANGHWTRGRQLSLRRAVSGTDLDFLSDQDRAALAFIRTQRNRSGAAPLLDMPAALAVLVGHPALFWSHQPDRSVQLLRGEPTVLAQRIGEEWLVSLAPGGFGLGSCTVVREAPDRLRLLELRPEHQRLARILGPDGLRLPGDSETRLLEILTALQGRLVVAADLTGMRQSLQPAQGGLIALLSPHGQGIALQLVVLPGGDERPAFLPGQGSAVLADPAGQPPLLRSLDQELAAAGALMNACADFVEPGESPFSGISKGPIAACEVLDQLHANPHVRIRWPEGEHIRIAGEGRLGALNTRIHAGEQWLSVEGGIKVDERRVLDLQALLEAASRNERFVALGDGRFLRLQEALRARAAELAHLGEWSQGALRLHPLIAPRVREVLDAAGPLRGDRAWTTLLARQTQALAAAHEIPAGLCAELRDYQRAGFQWLARLADLGAGACLADDMGLGKTIQMLTLLLHRAALGPALVVAPTSVAGNWVAEAARFAPSLKVTWIGPGQREQDLPVWQAGHLVVTSYTLFQQDALGIASAGWATVVLDEAQAIKNTGTKRSQTAMRIQAGFRVITTGTPIENNLSELWNLFRFINPGLLGSLESFQERFATPVERDGEADARERLKRLIAPFVLRRTKAEVLRELPERTEVTMRLELSSDERALYEAVRREALSEVESGAESTEPNRMRVLAGIMRLRRMCCHPRLATPEHRAATSTMTASKTHAFLELVRELREGGHRALVFSQFVDHLTALREQLDARQIAYQYLDGGTPLGERMRRVTAFQNGEAELFLISLRAGGTGLNLTAADYVIHMDPWWNPAVEDQASDRAHRMGQTRPVTVYRLVMADSIEEKIMALHERKRHLADSLLDGAGEAATLSVQELLGLLREA